MKRAVTLLTVSAFLFLLSFPAAVGVTASSLPEVPTVADVSRFEHLVWLLFTISICMAALTFRVSRTALKYSASSDRINETPARKFALLNEKLRYYCGVLTLAQVVLLAWLLFTRNIPVLPHDFVPSPVDLIAGLYAERVGFFTGACWSTGRLLVAFLLAVSIGLPLGIVCGRSRQAAYFTPYSSTLAVLPPIVLAPFFLYLFSRTTIQNALGQASADRVPDLLYDETFRIAATGFAAFWSVFSSALRASAKTKAELLQAAEGLGAGLYQRLRDVVLPLSLPSVFFGAKAGLTIGFIVLLYVEGIGASDKTRGLGGFIAEFYDSNNMSRMYAMICVVAFITLFLHKCLDALDAYFTSWDAESEEASLFSILLMEQKNEIDPRATIAAEQDPLSKRVRESFEFLLNHRKEYRKGETVIQFSGIKTEYNGRPVLCIDQSKEVTSGTVISLIGESGNGKTTLSRVIAGFIKPYAGSLKVAGIEVLRDGKPLKGFIRKITPNVAFMFQDDALFPHLTVRQNLEMVFRYKNPHPPEVSEEINNAIRLVRLEKVAHAYPSKLSGGEQQRLALARALLMEAPVLIIDEGLSSIDQPSKSLLRNVIRRLTKSRNLATLYISHDREDVLQIADRIWYLKNGNIIADEKPYKLYYNSKTVDTARFLGHTNLFRGSMLGDTLELQSYLDTPEIPMSPCSVQILLENLESPGGANVLAYVPKNSIEILTETAARHMRFDSMVSEPTFSGSEWELRIRVCNGAEFDVVLPEEAFRHFNSCLENHKELSVVVNDARILVEE